MKRLFRVIFFMSAVFLFQQNAVAADSLKLGVLDMQRCIKESNEGKRLYEALKKKHEALQKKLDEKQKELTLMQKELEKQSLMLSLDAKENKQKEFERNRRDLGYMLQDMNDEMNKAEAEAQKKIVDDLEKIVTSLAKRENYTLVIERRNGVVLFFSDTLDITSQIIEEYNKIKP